MVDTAEGLKTTAEAARVLGVSKRWLQLQLAAGKYACYRLPGDGPNHPYRLSVEQIQAIKDSMLQPAAGPVDRSAARAARPA